MNRSLGNGDLAMRGSHLRQLLAQPRSIAIIGASDDARKLSGRPIANLIHSGFAGRIIPINPVRELVQGIPAFSSLAEVDGPVDLCVIAVGAEHVEDALRQCVDASVPLAIIYASGYAEASDEGAAAQFELRRIATEGGVRILGPNTLGSIVTASGAVPTFSTAFDDPSYAVLSGPVAIVTQSGALGAYLMNAAMRSGVGVNYMVHTGNEVDLEVAEVMGALAEDPSVRVVLAYVEAFRDGRGLAATAKRAAACDTPLVVMKVGSSEVGAQAAASHTGAMAGSDAVVDATLRHLGVHRVEGFKELVDAGRIFADGRRARGNRLTVVTISGGAGILIADICERTSIDVPRWSESEQRRMMAVLPHFASAHNPIDMTAAAVTDTALLDTALRLAVDCPESDIVLLFLGNAESCEDEFITSITSIYDGTEKPLVVVWAGGNLRAVTKLTAHGVPVYDDPGRAVRAIDLLVNHHLQSVAVHSALPIGVDGRREKALALCDTVRQSGRFVLDEVESKRLLSIYGVSVVKEEVAISVNDVASVAEMLGLPVVVKVLSSEILHKSDHGLVRLGLATSAEAKRAAEELSKTARQIGATEFDFVVQPMLSGTELVAGVLVDPVFGPQVMIGLGGVLVEVLDDKTFLPAPFGPAVAESALRRLKGAALLDGVRGGAALDVGAVAGLLADLSVLADELADVVVEIDVNPVVVTSGGATAVDALVILNNGSKPRST
ncbi:MAG: acetate--CoA ligase family protein [Acidimicrobiales bacterium]